MKKNIFAAALVAVFAVANVNAQNVAVEETQNEINSIQQVVAELSQDDAQSFLPMYQKLLNEIQAVCSKEISEDQKTAKIENIKDEYSEKFSNILVTEQNEVAMNSISMEYINGRIAK
ncbi:MAG: hypothetical protein MJY58_02805 [Bacteroidaceae bacterium]|nr:hypothetical protein [Bacteroidaceae bacterium]